MTRRLQATAAILIQSAQRRRAARHVLFILVTVDEAKAFDEAQRCFERLASDDFQWPDPKWYADPPRPEDSEEDQEFDLHCQACLDFIADYEYKEKIKAGWDPQLAKPVDLTMFAVAPTKGPRAMKTKSAAADEAKTSPAAGPPLSEPPLPPPPRAADDDAAAQEEAHMDPESWHRPCHMASCPMCRDLQPDPPPAPMTAEEEEAQIAKEFPPDSKGAVWYELITRLTPPPPGCMPSKLRFMRLIEERLPHKEIRLDPLPFPDVPFVPDPYPDDAKTTTPPSRRRRTTTTTTTTTGAGSTSTSTGLV